MPHPDKANAVHCAELVTGKNLTGTLTISDEEMTAQIYGYDEYFNIPGECPIFLRVGNTNEIVSLHDNLTHPPGTHSRRMPSRITRRQDIVSNIAVVGPDEWTAEDKIKRVVFKVKHTDDLMHHNDKVNALGDGDWPNRKIFEKSADGMTLRAWYGGTWGLLFNTPKEFWPTFEIEFEEPRGIQEYLLSVSHYVGFLSFCLGAKLKPSEIQISRLSQAELDLAVQREEHAGDHKVHYVWPETEISSHDLWVGGSPVRAWDDKELGALTACLTEWMNRAAQWRKPYVLMMGSLGMKNVMTSERLLNACRWFEEIPISKAKNILSEDHIAAISTAAAAKAEELGYAPAINKRIAGSIARIKSESAEEQFTRLIATVGEKFATDILPNDAVNCLTRAVRFRGKSAHGHFNPESEDEYNTFSASTRVMEALCCLLTAIDLPISKAGIERIAFNPLVRDARWRA